MIETKPNQTVFKTRQLLFGNARQPHKLRAAHAASLPRVVETGVLRTWFAASGHRSASPLANLASQTNSFSVTLPVTDAETILAEFGKRRCCRGKVSCLHWRGVKWFRRVADRLQSGVKWPNGKSWFREGMFE